MPTRRAAQRDRCIGKADHVDIGRVDTRVVEAEAGRLVGIPALGVFVADEALFLCRRDQLTVDKKRGRGVVADGPGDSQYDHEEFDQLFRQTVDFASVSRWKRAGLAARPEWQPFSWSLDGEVCDLTQAGEQVQ